MSRPRARRLIGGLLLVVIGSAGLVACGDDVPSKEEFTAKIGSVTGGKVDQELAGCIYQQLGRSNGELLLKASQTPELTKAEEELLTVTLSRCYIEQYERRNPEETTTTERDPDT